MKKYIAVLFVFFLCGCGCESQKPDTLDTPIITKPKTPVIIEPTEPTEEPIVIDDIDERTTDTSTELNEKITEIPSEPIEIITPEESTETPEDFNIPIESIIDEFPEPKTSIKSFEVSPDANLLKTLESDGRFSTFVDLLKKYNLTDILTEEKSITVFAPLDEFFDALLSNPETESLLNDEIMPIILLSHMTPGKLTLDDIIGFDALEVYSGVPILVDGLGGDVRLNESASVIDNAISGPNGIIHPINNLIMPILDPIEETKE